MARSEGTALLLPRAAAQEKTASQDSALWGLGSGLIPGTPDSYSHGDTGVALTNCKQCIMALGHCGPLEERSLVGPCVLGSPESPAGLVQMDPKCSRTWAVERATKSVRGRRG